MGSVVALGTAAGCATVRAGAPQLLSVKGDLPKAWLQELPSPWQSQRLEGPEQLLSVVDRSALSSCSGRSNRWDCQGDGSSCNQALGRSPFTLSSCGAPERTGAHPAAVPRATTEPIICRSWRREVTTEGNTP